MKFGEYLTEKIGNSWALCRATKANQDRYAVCLTQKRYNDLGRNFVRERPEDAIRNWHCLPSDVMRELDSAAEQGIARARMDAARSLYGPRQEGNDHG